MKLSRLSGNYGGETKGVPAEDHAVPLEEFGQRGWNLLRGSLPLPAVVLKESALIHNVQWMQKFVDDAGALFAPHGKTTMSPQLLQLQLDHGAWGITAATMHQVRIYRSYGIGRILLANQLLSSLDVAYISRELRHDENLEFLCLVDSVEGVQILSAELARSGIVRPLEVLVEVGIPKRRTGCRTIDSALDVARAVSEYPDLMRIAGVEGFEGLVRMATDEETEQVIADHLDMIVDVASALSESGLFQGECMTLTAGGSSHFDMVIDHLNRVDIGITHRVILRSGCYITHDHLMYRSLQQRMLERRPELGERGAPLMPAMEAWAHVQSRPEPDRVICGIGKRDIGVDILPPSLEKWYRPGMHNTPVREGIEGTFSEVHDQHAILIVPEESPLQVGDLVCIGMSHPCTTFDKWRVMSVVDDDYNVSAGIETFF